MAQTIAQKLRIREQMTLLTLHAPTHFNQHLSPLPEGVKIKTHAATYHQVHWFVKTKAAMEQELDHVMGLLHDDVLCWIYYPKGTSSIQTDLTRDKGWEVLQDHPGLKWLSLVSFDDTWSAFGLRLLLASDKPAEAPADKPRAIFEFIDPATKTVRLPPDFTTALDASPSARTHFESLSFSHRKEYLEWIVTAKKAETRQQRIEAAITKLNERWKNPRNM